MPRVPQVDPADLLRAPEPVAQRVGVQVLDRWNAGLCDGIVLALPPGALDDDGYRALVGRCRDNCSAQDARAG